MPWKADPDKKATAVCGSCGEHFTYYKSSPKEFCSKACFGASRRTTTVCPVCGETFAFQKAWPRRYCSRKCAGKVTVVNATRPARPPIVLQCGQCRRTFHVTPANAGRRFCSRPCSWAWRKSQTAAKRAEQAAKRAPRRPYRRPPQQRTCGQCGIAFIIKPTEATAVNNGRGRMFCSRSCWSARMSVIQSGENSPSWKGGPAYGVSWPAARDAARARDLVCADCGRTPEQNRKALDVHHLVPFRSFGIRRHVEANALENLVALCQRCHIKREWATNWSRRWPFADQVAHEA